MTTDSGKSSVDVFGRVKEAVMRWHGVLSQPHRFGGIEFRVGGKEMGHMHGSRLADFPFPMSIRDRLVKEGKVEPHHVLPNSGWVSYWINGESDIDPIIELFHMQYERLGKSTMSGRING
jgi:luciferase-like monooxygenase